MHAERTLGSGRGEQDVAALDAERGHSRALLTGSMSQGRSCEVAVQQIHQEGVRYRWGVRGLGERPGLLQGRGQSAASCEHGSVAGGREPARAVGPGMILDSYETLSPWRL